MSVPSPALAALVVILIALTGPINALAASPIGIFSSKLRKRSSSLGIESFEIANDCAPQTAGTNATDQTPRHHWRARGIQMAPQRGNRWTTCGSSI
jgi:hypothetical protein